MLRSMSHAVKFVDRPKDSNLELKFIYADLFGESMTSELKSNCQNWKEYINVVTASNHRIQPMQISLHGQTGYLFQNNVKTCNNSKIVHEISNTLGNSRYNNNGYYKWDYSCNNQTWSIISCNDSSVGMCVVDNDVTDNICDSINICSTATTSTSTSTSLILFPCMNIPTISAMNVLSINYKELIVDDVPMIQSITYHFVEEKEQIKHYIHLYSEENSNHHGLVYCKAYQSNLLQVPTSTSAVIMNNIGYAIEYDTFTKVELTQELLGDFNYDVYCVTISSNSGMTLKYNDMIENQLSIIAYGSRKITIDLMKHFFIQSQGIIRNVLKINIDAFYTNDIKINIRGRHKNSGVEIDIFTPSTIVFQSSSTLSGVLSFEIDAVVTNDNAEGIYEVILKFEDQNLINNDIVQIHKIPTSDSNALDFRVYRVNDKISPPSLIEAVFSNDGVNVIITFDIPTDLASYQYSLSVIFDCHEMFIFENVDMTYYTCIWETNQIIRVSPVTATTTSNNIVFDNLIYVGTKITFQSSFIDLRADCPVSNSNTKDSSTISSSCGEWPISSDMTTNINGPLHALRPNIIINAPTTLVPCSYFLLDFSESMGNIGRPWSVSVINISYVPIGSPTINNINSSNNNFTTINHNNKLQSILNKYNMNDTLSIKYEQFLVGLYNFNIKKCNFLLSCRTINHRLQVLNTDRLGYPVVNILGRKQLNTRKNEPLLLQADAFVPSCNDEESKSLDGISFTWSIYKNGLQVDSIISSAKDKSIFQLLPYSLESGETYDIIVTAKLTNSIKSSTETIIVNVLKGDIQVIVNGGVDILSTNVGYPTLIDASSSIDLEFDKNDDSHHNKLIYQWSCRIEGSNEDCLTSSIAVLPINYDSLDKFEVLCTNIGSLLFDVVIYEDTDTNIKGKVDGNVIRKSTASIKVIINPPQYPIISITNNNDENDFIQTQGYIETFAEYKWSSTPSLALRAYKTPKISKLNIKSSAISIPLRLDKSVMLPSTSYTFTISLNYYRLNNDGINTENQIDYTSFASTVITSNGPPILGQLNTNRINGIELIDIFNLRTLGWEDMDLPLSYAFGFYDNSDNGDIDVTKKIILTTKNFRNYGSFLFPAFGNKISSLTCYAQVFDLYDSTSIATNIVEIYPLSYKNDNNSSSSNSNSSSSNSNSNSSSSNNNIGYSTNNTILDSNPTIARTLNLETIANTHILNKDVNAMSPMEAKTQLTFINTMTAALNVANCYNVSIYNNDNNGNRSFTNTTANTAGNTTATINITTTADTTIITIPLNCGILNRLDCSSTINTCGPCYSNYHGEMGDHNTPCYSLKSFNDSYELMNQELMNISRDCINNCSNHGTCIYYSYFNYMEILRSCTLNDACIASCKCDEGYYGHACQFTLHEQEVRQSMRIKLFNISKNIESFVYEEDIIEQYKQKVSLTTLLMKQLDESSLDFNIHSTSYLKEHLKQFMRFSVKQNTEGESLLEQIFDSLNNLIYSQLQLVSQSHNGNSSSTSIDDKNLTFILARITPAMDIIQEFADVSLFETLSSQKERHYRSHSISQVSGRLSMFDVESGDEMLNKSISLPLSGQNSYINAPVVLNIPLTKQSKEFSPGISVLAFSNILVQPLLFNNSFNIKMNSKVNQNKSESDDDDDDDHLFDTGRLLSDMIRVDVTDNIQSVGSCVVNDDNVVSNNNFTLYLPRNDAYVSNKPMIKPKHYYLFCRRFETKSKIVDCFGTNITLVCDGQERKTINYECSYNIQPSCSYYDSISGIMNGISDSDSDDGSSAITTSSRSTEYCSMVNFNETYITCSCDVCLIRQHQQQLLQRRRLNNEVLEEESSSYGMHIVALTNYVLYDFADTVMDPEIIWDGDTYDETLTITLFVSSLWCLIAIAIFHAEKNIKNDKTKKKLKLTSVFTESNIHAGNDQVDDEDSDNSTDDLIEAEKERIHSARKLLDYIQEIFPVVYSTKELSLYQRAYEEISNDHLFMKLNNEKNSSLRYAYHFEFFTMINITLMITAIITSIELKEDTGACVTYLNESDCLYEKSVYEFDKTLCLWDDESQVCDTNTDNNFNWLTVIVSTIIALTIAVPLRIILYCVFELVLRAPTSVPHHNEDDTRLRKASVVPLAIRQASKLVTNIAGRMKAHIKRKKRSILGGQLLMKPKPIVDLPTSILRRRRDAINHFNKYRSDHNEDTITYASNSDHDEDDDDEDQSTFYDEFNEIISYSLPTSSKKEIYYESELIFSKLNSELTNFLREGLKLGLPISEKMINRWDILILNNDIDNLNINLSTKWISKINDTLTESEKLLKEIQAMPPSVAGAQLLRHFIIDLLGRNTKDAIIFEKKSADYFGSKYLTTIEFKVIIAFLVVLSNISCIFICIAYGARNGPDWQKMWVYLCFITIFFLIFIDMSFEAAMIGFVIPSQTISSVRNVQLVLNQALLNHSLPRSFVHFHKGNNDTKNDNSFSASKFLHVSHYLAMNLKYLHESSFILSYKDPLPFVDFQSVESKNYNNRITANKNVTRGRNTRTVSPTDNNNKNDTDRDHRTILANLFSKFSFATFFIYIGTFPILFQRIVICLPIPIACSLFGIITTMIVNLHPIIWIIMGLIIFGFISWLVFGLSNDIKDICNRFAENLLYYRDNFNNQFQKKAFIKAARENLMKEKGRDINEFVDTQENNTVVEEELRQIRVDAEMELENNRLLLSQIRTGNHLRLKERLKERNTKFDRIKVIKNDDGLTTNNAINRRQLSKAISLIEMNDSDNDEINSWLKRKQDSLRTMNNKHEDDEKGNINKAHQNPLNNKLKNFKSTSSRRSFLFNYKSDILKAADLAQTQRKIDEDRERAIMKEQLAARLRLRFNNDSDWLLASSEEDDDEFEGIQTSGDNGDNDDGDNHSILHVNKNANQDNDKHQEYDDDDDDDDDDDAFLDDVVVKVNVQRKPRRMKRKMKAIKNQEYGTRIKIGKSGKARKTKMKSMKIKNDLKRNKKGKQKKEDEETEAQKAIASTTSRQSSILATIELFSSSSESEKDDL